MSQHKIAVGNEIWDKCSEYLEMIPEKDWDQFLLPVLARMLVKEKQDKEYYKMRLEAYEMDKMGHWE